MSEQWEPVEPTQLESLDSESADVLGDVSEIVPAGIKIASIIEPAVTQRTPVAAQAMKRGLFGWRPGRARRDTQGAEQAAAESASRFRQDLARIKTHTRWGSWTPTLVVANSKGGVGKTVTALLLAQGFTAAGLRVAVVDNNEEGNQRLRIPNAPVDDTQTVDHLAELVESGVTLTHPLLRDFMIRQPEGYWALASVTGQTHIDAAGHVGTWGWIKPATWLDIHASIAQHFDLVIIDSGTAQRASNHEAAFEVADLLVTPTRWHSDVMAGMIRLIADKAEQGHTELTTYPLIVEIVIRPDERKARAEYKAKLQATFPEARFTPIPFDPHLASAGPVLFDELHEMTRFAAIRMAAEAVLGIEKVREMKQANTNA